jgi:hypothetical protein
MPKTVRERLPQIDKLIIGLRGEPKRLRERNEYESSRKKIGKDDDDTDFVKDNYNFLDVLWPALRNNLYERNDTERKVFECSRSSKSFV